jgi:hypothetical protein
MAAPSRVDGNERSKQRQHGVKQPERAPAQCVEAVSGADLGKIGGPLSHYSLPEPGKRHSADGGLGSKVRDRIQVGVR